MLLRTTKSSTSSGCWRDGARQAQPFVQPRHMPRGHIANTVRKSIDHIRDSRRSCGVRLVCGGSAPPRARSELTAAQAYSRANPVAPLCASLAVDSVAFEGGLGKSVS